MSVKAPPTSEPARRAMNVLEAVICAALLGMATLLFSTHSAVIALQVTLTAMQKDLADIPSLRERVTRSEGRIEQLEKAQKEKTP